MAKYIAILYTLPQRHSIAETTTITPHEKFIAWCQPHRLQFLFVTLLSLEICRSITIYHTSQ